MNKDLNTARELLKNIHVMDENIFDPEIVTAHPDYTILITGNDFDEPQRPFTEVMSNADLLKLYDYAVRFFNGDPAFDGYDSTSLNIGNDDLEHLFMDLFYDLTETDRNHVTRVVDYEVYAIKKLKGERQVRKLHVISGGSDE